MQQKKPQIQHLWFLFWENLFLWKVTKSYFQENLLSGCLWGT